MLELVELRFGYGPRPDFLGPIDLSIQSGQCWAIVGPNGAGKSTLLRLMAGLLKPGAGRVTFEGAEIRDLPGRHRAKRVAFVPQHPPVDLDLSVRDVVLLGRFPHRSMGLFESPDDFRIADLAMEITETTEFADRAMTTLSGGEAQRVHVAAALAQKPQLLLLDEPTASLDLQHQLAIFGVLRDRARADGLGVVVVTHDVNLARRFCSHAVLLSEGTCVATGSPDDVLTPDLLSQVYGVELETLSSTVHPELRWVVPIGENGGRSE